MFTLAQLRQFVAVAEELHFGRAAERLQMTQPPLSRQIQLLEKELHVELFDRSSRAVKLTPAGRSLLADARRLLQNAERAALAVRRASEGRLGVLRVGFTAGSAFSGLHTVLSAASAVLGEVDIDLREMVTMEQVEAMSEGSIDLGMVRRPSITRTDLELRPLVREPLVVALPAQHHLASQRRQIEVTDLEGLAMVMYSPIESRYFFELVSAVLRQASVRPTFVQYLSQIHSLLALVNLGWGLAIVPESASKMHFDGVTYRALNLPATAHVELDLMWRASNDNPALHRLLAALAQRHLPEHRYPD
ncbi:LysR family transcriptional regulator [Mycobacterium sp. 48b]|uniref:LysR family transcriptional regulator n=1 Tax=Mycobacterium sp. 48b TaxID=3400426 RepID=UPI003AAF3EDB